MLIYTSEKRKRKVFTLYLYFRKREILQIPVYFKAETRNIPEGNTWLCIDS